MNGMNLSGKPGIVQAMQIPPTFGQPPTPFDPAANRDVALDHGAAAAELHETLPAVAGLVGGTRGCRRARRGRSRRGPCARRASAAGPGRRARAAAPMPASCSIILQQRLGDVVGLHRAAGKVDERDPKRERQSGAEVVAADPWPRSGCCASREPRRRRRMFRVPSPPRPSGRAGRATSVATIGWPVLGSTPNPDQ